MLRKTGFSYHSEGTQKAQKCMRGN